MDIPATIGRYEIIDELHRGAMGSLYRAKGSATTLDAATQVVATLKQDRFFF